MVESLLLHGYSALSTTLSPTVTSWCELLVPCADIGLHTGVQWHSVPKLCVQPTVYTQCHQSTSSGGPYSDCHKRCNVTLAEAATQLSFAEFMERCNLLRAAPPHLQPNPTQLLDAATQTFPHSAASADASTQLPLAVFSLGCIYPEDPLDCSVPPLARHYLPDVFSTHPSSSPRRSCADSFTQCRFCRCYHPTTALGVLSRVHLLQ